MDRPIVPGPLTSHKCKTCGTDCAGLEFARCQRCKQCFDSSEYLGYVIETSPAFHKHE